MASDYAPVVNDVKSRGPGESPGDCGATGTEGYRGLRGPGDCRVLGTQRLGSRLRGPENGVLGTGVPGTEVPGTGVLWSRVTGVPGTAGTRGLGTRGLGSRGLGTRGLGSRGLQGPEGWGPWEYALKLI